jgi:phospholipase/carboxylesterase
MRSAAFVLMLLVTVTACRPAGPTVTRITARPTVPTAQLPPGLHTLGLGRAIYRGLLRDGSLSVPIRSAVSAGTPLLVLLHGGGGQARDFEYLVPLGDEFGVALLALDARDNTWDGVDSSFGPDVQFIDTALHYTFNHMPVDPTRIAIGGISDGAMYALSVGLINGDLFTHVIAVAPGFMREPSPPVGKPRIFLGHGTRDNVYSPDGTRLRLLPRLRSEGYNVTYYEFDGPHWITAQAARAAMRWLVFGEAPPSNR